MVEKEKSTVWESPALQSSLDHVLFELKRIAFKLQLLADGLHDSEVTDKDNQYRGLYVTKEEVKNILKDEIQENKPPVSGPKGESKSDSIQIFNQIEKHIEISKKEALSRGLELRLVNFQRLFGLSQFDIDTLLICLLPEIDLRYQRLFAYLQDDITKKSPTVDLIIQLLCNSPESKLKARQNFSNDSPLMVYQFIHLHDDPLSKPPLLLAKYVQIDERIINYLLDSSQIDNHLLGLASLMKPEIQLDDVILSKDIKSRLLKFIDQNKTRSWLGYFAGSDEARKQIVASAVSSKMGTPLLHIEINKLLSTDFSPVGLIPLFFREGRLQNAILYFSGFDALMGNDKEVRILYARIIAELRNYPLWSIISGEKEWQAREILGSKTCFNIEISTASYQERTQEWNLYKDKDVVFAPDVDLLDIAGKFRFTSGQISEAVAMARNLAVWRNPGSSIITNHDLYYACRKLSREALNSLARKIQPTYQWKDIILPQDQMSQLHEISNYVAHYHKVYSDWGFGRKLSSGKGLNVLFAGPSGTGKTMAADVIANELGIDLYKIDLSGIVSKYIGETEKNLDQIFRDGQTSNAILFFDEADALFGKRSEVRDSHDRYANIEVAYLLQKMDDYDGIVILATNLRKNMDEAFARRMHYTLEFPIPEESDRYRIWQNIFPQEAPLAKDLDLKFMAKQFKITGGNIKNIALNAAFLATQNGGVIGTSHLIQSTKREYQKIGKLCTEGDFAQYFDLVKS